MPSLHSLLESTAAGFAIHDALITPTESYTYGVLLDHVKKAAAFLHIRLLGEGKKVAILLGNRAETVISMFAVSMAGGVFVNLNPQLKGQRLQNVLEHCDAEILISDATLKDKITEFVPQKIKDTIWVDDKFRLVSEFHAGPNAFYTWGRIVNAPCLSFDLPNVDSNNTAALMYTSGSTGKPKGVICSHNSMRAATKMINKYMGHHLNDKIITTLPLSHGYGLYQIFTALEAGARVFLEPGFTFPQKLLLKLEAIQATGLPAVPTMLSRIFKVKDWPEYMRSLRYITNAGAALSPKYYKLLRENLPDTEIVPMYGQTECVRALYNDQLGPEATGVAIPGSQVGIEKDGELWVQGDHVMSGYYKDEAETAKTFRNGKLYTGDIFEQKGNLFYYVGRKDDVVKIRGERVAPKEVEDVIIEAPGVNEVCVLTEEDEDQGYILVAHVSTKGSTNEQIIKRFCKENMEPHLIPSKFIFWKELPRNDNGKIDRTKLRGKENGK